MNMHLGYQLPLHPKCSQSSYPEMIKVVLFLLSPLNSIRKSSHKIFLETGCPPNPLKRQIKSKFNQIESTHSKRIILGKLTRWSLRQKSLVFLRYQTRMKVSVPLQSTMTNIIVRLNLRSIPTINSHPALTH